MPAARALAGTGALVTGGGSGIGLACARHLLRDGASVTIVGRTEDRLRAAVESLAADRPDDATVTWVRCDVTVEDDVASAMDVADRIAPLGIVVANAGSGVLAPLHTMTRERWDDTMATNVTGTFLAVKHAAPPMAARGGGAIVAVSSIAGHLTHRYLGAYAVSKAAVDALVRNAADELGHAGIRVNGVRPGLVHTDMGAAFERDPAVQDDYLAQMPLGRVGTVDDVASLVRFLASPDSSWITGQVVGCDGGHSLRRGPDLGHWARTGFGSDVVDRLQPSG
jgi:NAD(P)-dependent dehydrogenase (short-subunit alcohol dehydrogenase family)